MNDKRVGPNITLGDLITKQEERDLRLFLAANPRGIGRTTHNLVLKFLARQPAIMERFRTHGIIKAYGAYLFEYYWKL
jgi:hypothetical protein